MMKILVILSAAKNLVRLFQVLGWFIIAIESRAWADNELRSTVQVSTATTSNKTLVFTFKVVPKDNLIINHEGLWELTINQAHGLTFPKNKLNKNDFDQNSAAFTLETANPPSAANGKVTYKLISFVCTPAKERCFRDVHNSEYSWKK